MAESEACQSFEEAFRIAEEAARNLDQGELSLEKAIGEYERGKRALNQCYAFLKKAQTKIEVLAKQESTGDGDTAAGGDLAWRDAGEVEPLGEALGRIERERGSAAPD